MADRDVKKQLQSRRWTLLLQARPPVKQAKLTKLFLAMPVGTKKKTLPDPENPVAKPFD